MSKEQDIKSIGLTDEGLSQKRKILEEISWTMHNKSIEQLPIDPVELRQTGESVAGTLFGQHLKEFCKLNNFADYEEASPVTPVESDKKIEYEQLIRNSLCFFSLPECTHIVVIAVDKSGENNRHELLKCIGEPIGGYAYDVTRDAYYVRYKDCLDLGSIPVCFKVGMPNSSWVEFVALPDELIERCMTTVQKKHLNAFRDQHKDERFTFQYLQSIDC